MVGCGKVKKSNLRKYLIINILAKTYTIKTTMNKRVFLKNLSTASLGLISSSLFAKEIWEEVNIRKTKNWVWAHPDVGVSKEEWKTKLAKAKSSGIDAVLLEVYVGGNEVYFDTTRFPVKEDILGKVVPICKELGLEFHAWMWTMPCNNTEIAQKQPDWYVVNRKGERADIKPAYVDYYKFLCPTHPEVQDFVQANVRSLAQINEIDGVHLDYVRLPDVILPEALQPNYKIVQEKEYPEYDYCYSELCRQKFKEQTGLDPLKDIQDPATHQAWLQFRYDSVSNLVNKKLVPEAKKYNKMITAAVFPNWKNVRQHWHTWDLDAYLPMLYHQFYNEKTDWLKKHTKIGVNSVKNKQPIYSGIYTPDLSPQEFSLAIKSALAGGGSGVSLFSLGALKEPHWQVLKKMFAK
jgi:uncharacterized lipoprotein YddW (UPF0748 family)